MDDYQKKLGFIGLGAVALLFLFSGCFAYVNQGHRGVLTQFGARVNPAPLQPGLQVKYPLISSLQEFNVRIQDLRADNQSVKTQEGLNMAISSTLRFRLQPEEVNSIFDDLGTYSAFKDKIANSFQAALKEEADQYSDEELYKTESQAYADSVAHNVANRLDHLGITIMDVMINNRDLPDQVENAIEAKTAEKHKIQQKRRQIEREEQEKRRKIVEAEGIAESNHIINRSLTDNYLTWYWIRDGIEKTDSVIYVPSKGGLPLFRNVDDPIPGRGDR